MLKYKIPQIVTLTQMNSIFKIFIFLNNYIFRHKGSFCQSIEIPIAL